uniref:Secreted protein n=1 Tax=Mesocestoides corti TaxID=53468 RepID=A0A5K3G0B0_MESCO
MVSLAPACISRAINSHIGHSTLFVEHNSSPNMTAKIEMMVWCVVADTPTEKERTNIAEFFKKLRESVDPPASNMQLMMYSSELEMIAQNVLANCPSGRLDRRSLPG